MLIRLNHVFCSGSIIFSPTIFISSFFSFVLQNVSMVTSRILPYFSTGLVLLFIHSNVHVHVILLNMKCFICSVVNILICLTYLSLLFLTYFCLSHIVFSLWLIFTSFLEASSSCIFLRMLHSFLKMLSGSPAGGHFQRNLLRLVFFRVIIFHVSNDSFSLSDYFFLNEKRAGFRFNHRQGVWVLFGSMDWTFG